MRTHSWHRILLALLLAIGILVPAAFTQSPDVLERGFQDPPASARPRVWWHWMNGNITREGIKLDLEWMKRAGIAGFQNFDAALSTPQIVPERLVYMTPKWKEAFRYAATLADEFGLEMAIAGSPGWSESGGPWVPPSQGMKKIVWSETRIEGGRPFHGVLAAPPSTTGPFQNIPRGGGVAAALGGKVAEPPHFYADSAVIAYRAPDADRPITELKPVITSSGGQFDVAQLTDGDLMKSSPLPMAPAGEKAWIQFEFPKPQTVHAFTLAAHAARNPWEAPRDSGQELEASDDGREFHAIAKVPSNGAAVNTVAFKEVTAKYFRLAFRTMPQPPPLGSDIPGFKAPPPPAAYDIAELVLHTAARLNRFEEKAAFSALPDLYSLATPPVSGNDAIAKSNIVDLTPKMRADGTLDWTPPPGRWVVLRFGYSLLGVPNHPASPEATGLEVDKLNRTAVKAYVENYLDQYKDTVGPLMGKRGLQYVITDSWEAGTQNWTDNMPAEFQRRRGYDLRPWMPVLTGRVIESSEASERLLWDFRKTIGELTAEYHYDQIGESLHARGMGRYSESHESGRAFIGDGMEVKKNADVPMSAMWTGRPGQESENYGASADIRESSAVAHIYGQNLVAAESLTAIGTAWQWSPETLKPTADKELANGLNRFVIHTSVHQPVSDKIPGLGLGPFGQWFTRHETWAEEARPWTTYLARSSYMLQQGKFVADIAYFYGEDSNITAIFADKAPDVPAGYNYDYVNADALINRLSVKDGRLVTPTGMGYRVLVLDPYSRHMSLPVLRRIRDIVKAGATVVGPKPTDSPSLADDQSEFHRIANDLWDSGKIDAGRTAAAALASMHAGPDFECSKPQSDTNVLFVHRVLADGDVYWVDSRNNAAQTVNLTFRVEGKAPELWNPETGKTTPASYRIAGGRTTLPVHFDPYQAMFVVFRKPATASSRDIPPAVETVLGGVEGPWSVAFQPNRGAPESVTFDALTSWAENADAGVKYFSGTATYKKTLHTPSDWFKPGAQLWLDLGEVKNIAEVSVNGKPLGIVWKTPFRVDATGALRPGANEVEIKVTNLWVNRLIGDQQPNALKKYTYTTQQFYKADSPLLPSGLLGPVRVINIAGGAL